MRDQRLYLVHIAEALRLVLEYAAAGPESFFQSQMLQDAIIRRFEVIGEAVRRLSPEIRSGAPEIPWSDLAGLRNLLAHQYDRIDPEQVWEVVTTEAEHLLGQVETYLNKLGVEVPDVPPDDTSPDPPCN